MQAYAVDAATIRTMYATLSAVFPYVVRTLASIAHGQSPILARPADEATERRVQSRRAYLREEFDLARLLWPQEEGSTMGPMDLTMLAELTADAAHVDTYMWIAALARQSPIEAAIVAALWHDAMGRPAEAANALATGLAGYRKDPWPHRPLMARWIDLARKLGARNPETSEVLIDALSQPLAVHMLDELRRTAYIDVTSAVDSERFCVGAFAELEPWPVWTENMLELRHQCYARADHPLAARGQTWSCTAGTGKSGSMLASRRPNEMRLFFSGTHSTRNTKGGLHDGHDQNKGRNGGGSRVPPRDPDHLVELVPGE